MKEQTSVRTPHRRLRASLWKSSSLLAVALAAVALSGCAETITGLSVAYARGNLETVVPVDFQATRLAAEQSLDNMDVHLTRNELKREKAVLVGRNLQNQRVKILIRPRTDEASKVAIRVGSFGKHAAAHEVWMSLQDELGLSTTVAQRSSSVLSTQEQQGQAASPRR